MGRIFDNLTQQGSALQNPNTGQDTFVGSPAQVLSQSNTNLRSQMAPNFSDPMAQAPALPRIGNASFSDAASVGAQAPGGANALSPALSKGGKLLTLLSGGLQGAMAGRAASEQAVIQSGGHRSGGIGTGFEAGVQLPFLRAAMQQNAQKGALENQQLQNQVGMAPQMNLLKILQGQSEIQKNLADAAKGQFVTPRSGGVYDIKSGQFAPGTEPQDKALTIDNLLGAAVAKAQQEGRDPAQDQQVRQLTAVKTSLQKETQPKTQNDFEQYYAKFLKDNNLQDTAANMQRAHQQFEVKPQQPGTGDARLDRSYQFNSGQLEKVRTPIDAVAGRLGNLGASLSQGTPQSDALVAPELLSIMAGGQGSGLRMNEAEIARIVGGRSKWQSLQAAVNQWALDPTKANSITPEQRTQIRSLYQSVQDKITRKKAALEQAEGALIDADTPTKHRQVVADLRRSLDGIDAGGGQISVTDPKGGVHTFPDQASADKFKKLAGIR